jgi:hypothetical protein
MLLTRLAFWCLPDPPFTRCLGGFGRKLDPSSRSITTRWFDFVKAHQPSLYGIQQLVGTHSVEPPDWNRTVVQFSLRGMVDLVPRAGSAPTTANPRVAGSFAAQRISRVSSMARAVQPDRQSGYQGYCDVEVSPESTEPIRFLHNFRALSLALQNAV